MGTGRHGSVQWQFHDLVQQRFQLMHWQPQQGADWEMAFLGCNSTLLKLGWLRLFTMTDELNTIPCIIK